MINPIMTKRIFSPLLVSLFIAAQGISVFAQTPQTTTGETPQPKDIIWEVCNETSFMLKIATVVVPKGSSGAALTGQGWTQLRPSKCTIVDAEKGTPRFVYARSTALHQGGIREWKGRHEYCVSEDDFTAKTDMSCALQNLTSAKFLRIVPTEQRTAFIEPANYGKKAQTAGLQRLLMDNGYTIKRVDGMGGRRTTQTLNKFLKANKLATNISVDQKFDALIAGIEKNTAPIGITMCNKTNVRIWSAIAYHGGEWWNAKGWWPIDAGQCVHPYNDSLKGNKTHIYARKQAGEDTPSTQDMILKVAEKKGEVFCIGETKFSSVKHAFCTDQGYISARFKTLPDNKQGVQIDFVDSDFTSGIVSGLRQ